MKLLTKTLKDKLVKNYETSLNPPDGYNPKPPIKFFNPCGAATWLISELDPETNIMFGLCDLGFGTPELGYVSLDELAAVNVGFGLGIERDKYFEPKMTLSEYATLAYEAGRIAA